jgi:hypothetical protein
MITVALIISNSQVNTLVETIKNIPNLLTSEAFFKSAFFRIIGITSLLATRLAHELFVELQPYVHKKIKELASEIARRVRETIDSWTASLKKEKTPVSSKSNKNSTALKKHEPSTDSREVHDNNGDDNEGYSVTYTYSESYTVLDWDD